jgi:26S proteasome regulatory subunit N1
MCPAAVAGLFSTVFFFLDANNSKTWWYIACYRIISAILNNRQHYLLYSLVLAMQPRLLITLMQDDNDATQLKQVNVSVRVGQVIEMNVCLIYIYFVGCRRGGTSG